MIAQPGHSNRAHLPALTYRHIQAQHEAARGGTRRRQSGAIMARCSGAHQRMRIARKRRSKKSAADAAIAATVSPLHAKRPSLLPVVLAVLVDARAR